MLPSAQQKKKISKKPFVQVRLVTDPTEAPTELKIKLKEPTLFVEIIHGNEDGTLNTQWIPLPLSHAPKIAGEEKTHYGRKNPESQELTHSSTEGKPQKRNFDLPTIDKFLTRHMRKNKFATSVLSSHKTVTNNRII